MCACIARASSLRRSCARRWGLQARCAFPLATKLKNISLDDGLKLNDEPFGPALKQIIVLNAKEEDLA